jgi:hypothetical protein
VGPPGQVCTGKRKGFGSVLGPNGWAGSVGPTRLGSARGLARPAAQQAGSGCGLDGREARLGLTPPRAWFLPLRGLAAHSSSSPRWAGLLPSPPRWAGCACSSPALTDRAVPGVGHGGIRCAAAPIRCGGKGVCVCVGRPKACAVRAPEGCSGKGGGRFAILSRGGRRGGGEREPGAGSRASGGRGKLTSGTRLSAAPGGKGKGGRDGSRSWAGPARVG